MNVVSSFKIGPRRLLSVARGYRGPLDLGPVPFALQMQPQSIFASVAENKSYKSTETANDTLGARPSNDFDVLIVGGGASGTALFYTLSHYTNLKRIALCERRSQYAQVASHFKNNSQTIHCGDIETNYTAETASRVKRSANILRNFLSKLPPDVLQGVACKGQKMVIGVGDVECDFIEKRYQPFKEIFPNIQLIDKQKIAEVEPKVALNAKGNLRPEPLNALYIDGELTTANFMELSNVFVQRSDYDTKHLAPMLNTEVKRLERFGSRFKVTTNNGTFTSSFVVFDACGYSLLHAQRMGIGLEYSVLPVSGSFYFGPKILRGKVYTVQNPLLPFAAIHGDPDIGADGLARFGPTALPLPLLERYNLRSFFDFLRVLRLDANVIKVYFDLLKVSTIRNYMLRNLLFEIPLVSKMLFLKDVRKIIPSLQLGDIKYSVGYGGVRPQLVDKKNQKLLFGQSRLSSNDGCIFNVTASPGATTCLSTAEGDAREICNFLGADILEEKLKDALYRGEYPL